MLPTSTTIDTGREAVNRDFTNIDSLIAELAVPKEQITRNVPGAVGSSSSPGSDSGPQMFIDGLDDEPLSEAERMPAEIAALSGKTIANTVDTALGTGFSLYAKNTTPEKYQATEKQLQNLENAWAAVAAKYNYRVEDSPWFNVILLNVAVYLPHFQEAKNDRRFAEVEERFKELEKRQREAEEKLSTAILKIDKPTA